MLVYICYGINQKYLQSITKNLIIFCIHIYQEKLEPIKKLSNHRYFLQMLSLVLLRQEEEEGTKIGY